MDVYDNLINCYMSSDSNEAKASKFRLILEDFAKKEYGVNRCDNLSLSKILDSLINERNGNVKYRSRDLLAKLNKLHHDPQKTISSEELQCYYKSLVEIAQELTRKQPDVKTKILTGITDAWYTEGLNYEQKRAVLDDSPIINVNAGPGTGKTRVLIHKMMYYLKDNPNRNIVALSFTNTAASQLSEKFNDILSEMGKSSDVFKNVYSATIHSYCYRLLSDFYTESGSFFDFEIIDDSDIDTIAEQL